MIDTTTLTATADNNTKIIRQMRTTNVNLTREQAETMLRFMKKPGDQIKEACDIEFDAQQLSASAASAETTTPEAPSSIMPPTPTPATSVNVEMAAISAAYNTAKTSTAVAEEDAETEEPKLVS